MTKTKALVAGLAVLCAGALPAAGVAGSSDRDRDGMRDRWERKHRAFSARADHDRDRLKNITEYRRHTNPRDADTDNDGVRDGADRYPTDECKCGGEYPKEEERPKECGEKEEPRPEQPPKEEPRPEEPPKEQPPASNDWLGEVASYENGVLKLHLREGGELEGRVTEATKFTCERRHSDGRIERWQCSGDWLDVGSKVASARLEEGDGGKTFVEVNPLRYG